MTTFLRLLSDHEKAIGLAEVCAAVRVGRSEDRVFDIDQKAFLSLPASAFAYWTSEAVRHVFRSLPAFERENRLARQGLATADDPRFLRLSWELGEARDQFLGFAKGGAYSPFYADIYLWLNWRDDGAQIRNLIDPSTGKLQSRPQNIEFFRRCGLTWPRRTKSRLSLRVLPAGCAFGDKGPAAFVEGDSDVELLCVLALGLSRAFYSLVEVQLAAADARPGGAAHSFEVGVIQRTPVPELNAEQKVQLARLAHRAWSLKRASDTVEETSHAFVLPALLRSRLGDYDPAAIEVELNRVQADIDRIAFDLYGFGEPDRAAVRVIQSAGTSTDVEVVTDDDSDEEDIAEPIAVTDGLLSWAVGVVFGRFDLHLATGERTAPAEPAPFGPLPKKSPGMLPDGAVPFHTHFGVLVEDAGHPHDVSRLVEEVLLRVEVPVPSDLRRWLQKDFFPFHLQRYSKSRRKAPIYWPLATASGSYTLWIYYPSLTSQTLYTAINDFLDGPSGKLREVAAVVATLRNKGSGRTREDEKQFEALQALELELLELRDTLLSLAPTYKPNHDDGVLITAAPLWNLFRHRPWQKLLKDTWAKLERGEYDWAHLAMNYWPERVREKCKTDKSLAIAHGLESLYVAPEVAPKKTRGKMKGAEA
jgi:hypothetical protein